MIFKETKLIRISYLADINAVYAEWLNFPSVAEYREGMDWIIDALKHHKSTKILTNPNALGAIATEQQDWTLSDWLPRALAIGYNKIAIIVPTDIFNQMSVEQIMSNVGPLNMAYFEDFEKAKAWL